MATHAPRAKKTAAVPGSFDPARYALRVLVGFTLLIYFTSLFNGYNMDDELVTHQHKLTSQGIKAIPEILTSPYYSDDMGYQYEYRPMVHITFAIEHQLFGERPWVSHTINLLIYLLLLVAVYRLLSSLLGKEYTLYVLLVSLLFAAFPLHTEAVCSIKNRDELLAALLGLYTAHLCLLSVQKQNHLYTLAAVLTLFMGLYTKQNIIHFVVIIPLLLAMFTSVSRQRLLIIVGAIALTGVSFSTLTFVWQKVALALGVGLLALLAQSFQDWPTAIHQARELVKAGKERIHRLAMLFQSAAQKSVSSLSHWLRLVIKPIMHVWALLPKGLLLALGATLLLAALYAIRYPVQSPQVVTFFGIGLWLWSLTEIKSNSTGRVLYGFSILWLCVTAYWHRDVLLLQIVQYLLLSWMIGHPQTPQRWWAMLPFVALLGVEFATQLQVSITASVILVGALYLFWPRLRWLSLLFIVGGIMGNISSIYQKQQIGWYESVNILMMTSFGVIPHLSPKWPHRIIHSMVLLLAIITLVPHHRNFSVPMPPGQVSQVPVMQAPAAPALNQLPATSSSPPRFNPTTLRNAFFTKAPKPIPFENFDRPLDFVEMPINQKTAPDTLAGTYLLVAGKYLRLLLVPYPMSFYYGYKEIEPQSFLSPWPIGILLMHLLLLGAAVYYYRTRPLVAIGLFIYLSGALLYSNIALPAPGIVAERFMLVPSIGFCMLLAALLFALFKVKESGAGYPLPGAFKYTCAGILVVYSCLTINRNFDWKNKLTLMRHDIRHVPQSAQAHNLLAFAIMSQTAQETNPDTLYSLRTEAAMHFKQALDIYPRFFNVAYDLGRVYLELNQPQNALEAFQRAEKIDPHHQLPSLCFTMADLYLSQGKEDSAIAQYNRAIRLSPTDYAGYEKLSYLYYQQKQYTKSMEVNLAATKQMPDNYMPYANIGHTYKAMNQKDSALYYYQKAQRINPSDKNIEFSVQQLNAQ